MEEVAISSLFAMKTGEGVARACKVRMHIMLHGEVQKKSTFRRVPREATDACFLNLDVVFTKNAPLPMRKLPLP